MPHISSSGGVGHTIWPLHEEWVSARGVSTSQLAHHPQHLALLTIVWSSLRGRAIPLCRDLRLAQLWWRNGDMTATAIKGVTGYVEACVIAWMSLAT